MHDLFISYSRDDRAFVERLHAAVEESGRDAWLDKFDIEKGQKFWKEIEQGIDGANAFVFVISPTSIKKAAGAEEYCRREIEYAVRQGKRIIPIVLCDLFQPSERVELLLNKEIIAHQELMERNWLQFYKQDFKSCFTELIETAEKDLEYVKMHTNLTVAAELWDKNKWRDNSSLLRGSRLTEAEKWLEKGKLKAISQAQNHYSDPIPTDLHQKYIARSEKYRSSSQRNLLFLLISVILGLSGLTIWALLESTDAQIRADSASSKNLLLSNRKIEALTTSIRAAKKLTTPMGRFGAKPDTKLQAIVSLRQVVYDISEANQFVGHSDRISEIDVSPDGEVIVSASSDGTVNTWDKSGKIVSTVGERLPDKKGFSNSIWTGISSVRFNPNGQLIAFPMGQSIQLIDRNGKLLRSLEWQGYYPPLAAYGISSISFSRDGKNILFYTNFNNEIRVEDLQGNLVKTINASNSYALSPDKKTIVFINEKEGAIKIWDYEGNFLRKNIPGKPTLIEPTFEPVPYPRSGAYLGGNRVFDFSPDGSLFASTDNDNSIKLRRIDGTVTATLLEHKKTTIISCDFSPNGQLIVTASSDGTLKIWEINGRLINTITGHSGFMGTVQFSPDGNKLITGGADGIVRIWSLQPIVRTSWQAHREPVFDLEFSPDGKTLATASKDHTIKIWDKNHTLQNTLTGHNEAVMSISFSSSGEMLASSEGSLGSEKGFRLWKKDGTFLKTATTDGYDGFVYEAKFNPKDNSIASNGHRGLGLWSSDGSFIASLNKPEEDIHCTRRISFSQDGQSIACLHTPTTRLFRYKAGLKVFKVSGSTSQFLFDLPGSTANFSSDDKLIATGGTDGNVRILDRNGTLLRTLTGHSQTVTDISFSPDAQMIASSSEDKTVKLWSRNGILIETLDHSDRVNTLSFSPDGKKLAVGVNDGTVVEWNLDLDDLLIRGCDWARDYLENNSNVSSSDKSLCRDVLRSHKP
jgi:WD40 repeat protein